ncbi:MAG: glutathione peroxidase [Chitinophagales bacterium]
MNTYDFEVKDITGKTMNLADYKGKVLMIVNIASKCGLTPQLDGLQAIYKKYRPQGFEILAFPSNQFAGQEPLNDDAIQNFCAINYGVTFRVFEKGLVKGKDAQPLYQYLAKETGNLLRKNYPVWNFQKYVIDKNGNVADWFAPWTTPESDKISESIEKCLKA